MRKWIHRSAGDGTRELNWPEPGPFIGREAATDRFRGGTAGGFWTVR